MVLRRQENKSLIHYIFLPGELGFFFITFYKIISTFPTSPIPPPEKSFHFPMKIIAKLLAKFIYFSYLCSVINKKNKAR